MIKDKIPTSPLRFIFHITKEHKVALFLAVFFILLTETVFALTPVILGKIVDYATLYSDGGVEIGTVLFFVILYPIARLIMILGIRGTGFMLSFLEAHMRTRTYRILFGHLSLHSNSYFSNRFAGSLSSDVNVVGQNMSRIARFLTYSVLGLLTALVTSFFVIASASLTLAVIYIFGIALLIPINHFLSKRTIKLSKKAIQTLSTLRGQVVDSITNISAVQQFAMRDRELSRLDDSIIKNQDADIKANIYSEIVLLINSVLVISFAGGVMYGAFTLWRDGSATLGQFIMVITLIMMIIRSLTFIGSSINEFSRIYGQTSHSLKEILIDHEIVDSKDAKDLLVENGKIEFRNVSFQYDEASKVFSNLSLVINDGERVGVVGPSGGGKTTLVKLILRQHDLDEGSILIDGNSLVDVTQKSLRSAVGIVPQDTALFHRTLRENISYGKPDATLDEVREAAKSSLIDEFIESLPEKYETFTGEKGIKLSGGQRQRVAIARAILKAAPILILDEATSALDSESEICVQKGLTKLMEGKTVIAIAHRLSTIQEMDRIIVFEGGEIVQDGHHEKLLKEKDGTYARLWNHQAGGFIVDDD